MLLLDVSGSMSDYVARTRSCSPTRPCAPNRRWEAFCFGTRLTRLTRALLARRRRTRRCAARAEAAPDRDGGTRIGESLKAFLDDHGHRGLARGAVVVICSDGLEVGDPALLGEQAERLARLAHRVVWLNPLKGDPAYEPLTRGMRAALPHVDVLASRPQPREPRSARRAARGLRGARAGRAPLACGRHWIADGPTTVLPTARTGPVSGGGSAPLFPVIRSGPTIVLPFSSTPPVPPVTVTGPMSMFGPHGPVAASPPTSTRPVEPAPVAVPRQRRHEVGVHRVDRRPEVHGRSPRRARGRAVRHHDVGARRACPGTCPRSTGSARPPTASGRSPRPTS